MSWDEAYKEWNFFLSEVEKARLALYCSYSNAWFRGHSDSEQFELMPSLFRNTDIDDPDFKGTVQKINQQIAEFPKKWEYLKEKKKKVKDELFEAHKRNDISKREELTKQLEKIQHKIIEFKKQRDETDNEQKRLSLIYTGERETFIEYSFRSGNRSHSSWETLAEMRHYGIPTRLLDWTEVLAVALYFALENYLEELNRYWSENKKKQKPFEFYLPNIASVPSIWIMNPYQASKEATGRLRIWDLTLDKSYDYFENFIVKRTWHFDKPITMYSPWRNNRIAAQQGMFTVFGYLREPLDKLFSKNVVREVKINPLAAVYGVKHLKNLLGLDHFVLFRDLDTLGKKITNEFIKR